MIPSAVLTYGSSIARSPSSSIGDGRVSSSFAPGIPGSANVSASEVTSGADGSTRDCVAAGAGICTIGTTIMGLAVAACAVLLVDSAGAGSDILGMEAARLGAGSVSDLGGIVGDRGLLSDPVKDFKDGQ